MVSGSLSVDNEGESDAHPFYHTYTELFEKLFPYYLSIGMTYDQFWKQDPTLVKYYREAEKLRNNKRNEGYWLQGMYIYEAICDVAPILHAFAKNGTKPRPYPDRPYAITKEQVKEQEIEREKKIALKGKRYMEMLMAEDKKKKSMKKGGDING